MIGFPLNLVNVKPLKGSLYVCRWSRSMLMVTFSPSRRACSASERQCTPAMSRPNATFVGEFVQFAAHRDLASVGARVGQQ